MKRSERYSSMMAIALSSSHGIRCGRGVFGSGSSSRKTIIISGGCPRLPDRPSRWRKLVTELGDWFWSTRSSLPMSMPSSMVTVAQVTNGSPSSSFMRSSASSRSAAERLP